MATRRKGIVAAVNARFTSTFNAEQEAKENALFESASRDINIVRAAGIVNGMDPEEVRRRILLAAAPVPTEPEKG
jgi:hypothetical protein